MRRDQYIDKLRNLNLQQQEMERKWRVYLMEQEMMEMARMSAQNQPFSSGGGVLPGNPSGPRMLILFPDTTWQYFMVDYDKIAFVGPFDTGVDSSLYSLDSDVPVPVQGKGFTLVFKSNDPAGEDPNVFDWYVQFVNANGEILQSWNRAFDEFSDVSPIFQPGSGDCFVLGIPTLTETTLTSVVQLFDGEKILSFDFPPIDGAAGSVAYTGSSWDLPVDGKIPVYNILLNESFEPYRFDIYTLSLQGEKTLFIQNAEQYGNPIASFAYDKGGLLGFGFQTETDFFFRISNLKTGQTVQIDAVDPTYGGPIDINAQPHGENSCFFIFKYDDGEGGLAWKTFNYNGTLGSLSSMTVFLGPYSTFALRSAVYSNTELRNFSSGESLALIFYTAGATQSTPYLTTTDECKMVYFLEDGSSTSSLLKSGSRRMNHIKKYSKYGI